MKDETDRVCSMHDKLGSGLGPVMSDYKLGDKHVVSVPRKEGIF
jgi:hypothetical protein